MKAWHRGLDLLPGGTEQVIPAAMTQDEIVRRVMADSGLAAESAVCSSPAPAQVPTRKSSLVSLVRGCVNRPRARPRRWAVRGATAP